MALQIFYGSHLDVVSRRQSLACVMQQQRQIQQLWFFQLGQNLGVSALPIGARFSQLVQSLDSKERVFIDSIAVMKVADHQRVNQFIFRNDALEQAQGMHSAQRLAGVGQNQDLPQMTPQIDAL